MYYGNANFIKLYNIKVSYSRLASLSLQAIGLLTSPWNPGQYRFLVVRSASVVAGCLTPPLWKYDAAAAMPAAAIPATLLNARCWWLMATAAPVVGGRDSICSMPCGLPAVHPFFISVIVCNAARGGLLLHGTSKKLNMGDSILWWWWWCCCWDNIIVEPNDDLHTITTRT